MVVYCDLRVRKTDHIAAALLREVVLGAGLSVARQPGFRATNADETATARVALRSEKE